MRLNLNATLLEAVGMRSPMLSRHFHTHGLKPYIHLYHIRRIHIRHVFVRIRLHDDEANLTSNEAILRVASIDSFLFERVLHRQVGHRPILREGLGAYTSMLPAASDACADKRSKSIRIRCILNVPTTYYLLLTSHRSSIVY